MQLGLQKPGPAVKWLLIINIGVFFVQIFMGRQMSALFAAVPYYWWQPWRYITFQFLHSTQNPMHLGFNMIGLYFLGMYLERSWGAKRFLRFYLICGVVAGLTHVGLSQLLAHNSRIPLVGASGGVFAVVIACAILFPHIRVIVLLFPMSIRAAAILFFAMSSVGVLMGVRNALAGDNISGGISHAAHFGGAIAGAIWIWLLPRVGEAHRQRWEKRTEGAWKKGMQQRQVEQEKIDRILDKIQREGLNSLSSKEREMLRDATRNQRSEDRKAPRL